MIIYDGTNEIGKVVGNSIYFKTKDGDLNPLMNKTLSTIKQEKTENGDILMNKIKPSLPMKLVFLRSIGLEIK